MHLRTVSCGVLILIAGCTNTTRGSLPDIDAAMGADSDAGHGGDGGATTGGSAGTGGVSGSGGVAGSGAVAGSGGTAGNGDASADAGTTCVTGNDCPASPSVCRIAVCNGMCSYELAAAGTASVQVSGDCRRVDCESDGVANSVVDNTDFDDLNPCTSDSCTNGFPTHTIMVGSLCKNGAGTCDASGRCIECMADADCGTSTECIAVTCNQGICQTQYAAAGALCNGLVDQCDGSGTCVDCVDNGGCDEASVCSMEACIPAP